MAAYTFFTACLLLVFGLLQSPALLSIGVGLAAVAGVAHAVHVRKDWRAALRANRPALRLVGYYGLCVIAVVYSANLEKSVEDVRIKLPLLLLPVAFIFGPNLTPALRRLVLLALVVFTTGTAAATFSYYLRHYETLHRDMLDAKPMRIATLSSSDVASHIYFSLILALSIWVGVYLFRRAKEWPAWLRWGVLACTVFNLTFLHILSSRTGLMAFYAAALVFTARQLVVRRNYRLALVLAAAMLILPAAAYQFSETFRNRVTVSVQDVQQYLNHEDLTFWSISRRIAVWETTWHVFLQHPAIGVSPGAVKDEVAAQFEREQFRILPEYRLSDPHNQFLEVLAGLGVVGFAVFAAMLWAPFHRGAWRAHPLFLPFFTICICMMLVEAVLERQVGVSYFAFFWLFFQEESS